MGQIIVLIHLVLNYQLHVNLPRYRVRGDTTFSIHVICHLLVLNAVPVQRSF